MSHQLNFLSANYFPFTGSIIVSNSQKRRKTAISRFKKQAPRLLCRERHTSKRKSKCFYFKIHHLQLSSKFVSPICRLHFSRHILVIDLNLYFLHALPPFFSLFPSLSLFLGNDGRIPCFISGAQNFKYINRIGYRQPRVNKFKKFSRFSLTEEEAAAWLLQCFSPSFIRSIFRKVCPLKTSKPCLVTAQKHGPN